MEKCHGNRNEVTVIKQSLRAGGQIGRLLILHKWVLKWNIDANGIVEHLEDRLVVQGCTQKIGLTIYKEALVQLFVLNPSAGFYCQWGLNTSCNSIKWMCLPHSYMEN